MGMFFEERIIQGIVPELKNFLRSSIPGELPEVRVTFQAGTGIDNVGFRVMMFSGEKYVGNFSMTEFPGNCGMVISHDMYIRPEFRRRGIASYLQHFKLKVASKYGFTLMYCTTLVTNDAENKILENYGWRTVNRFKNRRTGNDCLEWTVEVPENM